MARKDHAVIPSSDLIAIAEEYGMKVLNKKTEDKVFVKTKKQSLGIPKTTKGVTRVELVGFEHPVGVAHPKPPAGTVTQMLDFTKPASEVLKDFRVVCKYLVAEAEVEAEEAEAETTEQVEELEQDEAASA
jgi:hypothetical protein